MKINYEEPTPKTTIFKDICTGEVFREDCDLNEIYLRIEDAIVGGERVNCVNLFDGLTYYIPTERKCILFSATLTVREKKYVNVKGSKCAPPLDRIF